MRDRRAWWIAIALPLGLYGGCNGRGDDGDGAADADAGEDGDDDLDPLQGPGTCVDTRRFFEEQIWAPIMSTRCYACHNPNGMAKATDLVLQGPDYPGYLEVNYQTVQNLAQLEIDGTPLLLLKPSRQVDHMGGEVLPPSGEEYANMAELIERFDAPVHCVDDREIAKYYEGIVLLDPEQTLDKASLWLVGRRPTAGERRRVASGGLAGLDAALDQMMREEAFYDRLKQIYNDMLHTDAYLVGDDAVMTVDAVRFPNRMWYDALPEDQIPDARNRTNDAIAREPLEIIEWVVRNDRPFSEILTGDFTVVNPFSARSYGIPLDRFANPDDPNELIPWTFEDQEHAGLLTTSVFLNRYPSTPTNRNRARSRYLYEFFLATDVMRLASRPIDVSSIETFNPTLYDAACTVCHDNLDPLAGAFQNWDDTGRYRPPEGGWNPDMRPPGFGELEIPFDQAPTALRWLSDQLVQDRKFALSVVHTFYRGLTGQDPLREPVDPDALDYLQQIRAYEAQDYSFKQIADRFRDSWFDVRVVIKELVRSEWFRATGSGSIDAERALELQEMGTAHLLPPEQLHQRIVATTGVAWRKGGANALLSSDFYKFFYGGIDSASVTLRLTEMNGVMANIAERMANEVGCVAVPFDFSKPSAQRKMFVHVEPFDQPVDRDAQAAIVEQIRWLHELLLGERLDADDPEIQRTLALFEGVWQGGQDNLVDPADETGSGYPTTLPGPCQATTDPGTGEAIPAERVVIEDPDYTIRAWMAVVTYLLGDYRFLYE